MVLPPGKAEAPAFNRCLLTSAYALADQLVQMSRIDRRELSGFCCYTGQSRNPVPHGGLDSLFRLQDDVFEPGFREAASKNAPTTPG
jgi:hypothetical protein